MTKIIKTILIFIIVPTTIILLSMFIAGDTNLFEWHGVVRMMITTISIGIIILINSEYN